MKRVLGSVAAAMVLVLAPAGAVATPATAAPAIPPATQFTWLGGHSSMWSDAANWSPARVPQNGDALLFSDTVTPASTNDLVGLSVIGVRITGSGIVLSGNPLTLTGGVDATGTGGAALRMAIVLAGDPNLFQGPLSLSGAISGTGTLGLINGTTIDGGAPNTYTGWTVAFSGTLNLAKPAGTAAVPGNSLTIADGATVVVANPEQIADQTDVFVLAGGRLVGNGSGPAHEVPETVRLINVVPGGTLGAPNPFPLALTAATVELHGRLDLFYGQVLTVTGAVDLSGATLSLTAFYDPPPPGTVETLVDNRGGGPVTGTFAGVPEGWVVATQVVPVGGPPEVSYPRFFRTSYFGGTPNNDVTLTSVDSTELFVRRAYQLLLGRVPDPGGYQY